MYSLVLHLLVPRYSNNHKAKVLHTSSLLFAIAFLVISQLFLNYVPATGARVLGYASSISIDEVVSLTNQKRQENGASALTVNSKLVEAARKKGEDMIARDYWAHVAPDGTQPWSFFLNTGYQYRYAGENLARDFSNARSAVDAWMASSSHRDNLLSTKYTEIGIAVVEGDLAGVDTTIIVQLFGAPQSLSGVEVSAASAATSEVDVKPTVVPEANVVEEVETTEPQVEENSVVVEETNSSEKIAPVVSTGETFKTKDTKISPFNATKGLSLMIIGSLMIVLALDWFITAKTNIPRGGGKTFAHLAFLGMVFAIVLIAKAGAII